MTEAGPAFQGTIKSAVAFGALLAEGIGDTIRVSLSAPPVEEVKVGNPDPRVARAARSAAWRSCRARPAAAPRSTSTPSPSRSPPALEGFPVPLRVAVMGCVVNGPGEAREADLGVASGNGKGQIFVKGRRGLGLRRRRPPTSMCYAGGNLVPVVRGPGCAAAVRRARSPAGPALLVDQRAGADGPAAVGATRAGMGPSARRAAPAAADDDA